MKFKKLLFAALTLFTVAQYDGECKKCEDLETQEAWEELEEHIEQDHGIVVNPLDLLDEDDPKGGRG